MDVVVAHRIRRQARQRAVINDDLADHRAHLGFVETQEHMAARRGRRGGFIAELRDHLVGRAGSDRVGGDEGGHAAESVRTHPRAGEGRRHDDFPER